jgi:hypothetical protein
MDIDEFIEVLKQCAREIISFELEYKMIFPKLEIEGKFIRLGTLDLQSIIHYPIKIKGSDTMEISSLGELIDYFRAIKNIFKKYSENQDTENQDTEIHYRILPGYFLFFPIYPQHSYVKVPMNQKGILKIRKFLVHQ